MDFQNVNPLNVWMNKISGNLLTMSADNSSFSLFWKIYSLLLWLFELIQIIGLIMGFTIMPKERVLKDGLIGLAIGIEVIFIVVRIQTRKGLVQRLIRSLNDMLHVKNEIMRNVVMATLKPQMKTLLKFYLIPGTMSVFMWTISPFTLIFQRNIFFYIDYRLPVIFSVKEPFSTTVFVAGSVVILISSVYIFVKKVSVDSYMIHMILLITAQYKYTALKLAMIFQATLSQNNNGDTNEIKSNDINQYAEKEIKIVCQHHNAVLHITFMFRELLSSNLSIMYLNSVFRFCCIAIMVISVPQISALEGFILILYAWGGIVQLYVVCSCMQQLLDATIELTDQAFHEEWYRFNASIKRMLIFIIMANNLDLKFALFERYNMSLASFMTILNQSYSIALLLLRTN